MVPGCRERLIKKMVFDAATERTINSEKAYRAELEKVAQCGYALDIGECMHGVHCLAAAIRDADGLTVGALCITGHADRFPEAQLPWCADQVIASAERISYRLGYRKPKIARKEGRA
jgi:DNA-binding IclR family transcriptional regulator